MKDVMIRIKGHQKYNDDEEKHGLEYITEAKFYEKEGSTYLVYTESEEIGFINGKTTVQINENSVTVTREEKKDVTAVMEFIQGKRGTTLYVTPAGKFALEILTNKIENSLDVEEGKGRLFIDSYISLRDFASSRNTLEIEII